MKRVTHGESKNRLRNSVTDQLTENPESDPLGVFSFWPINLRVYRLSGGAESAARARAVAGGRRPWSRSGSILSRSLTERSAQLTAPCRCGRDCHPHNELY